MQWKNINFNTNTEGMKIDFPQFSSFFLYFIFRSFLLLLELRNFCEYFFFCNKGLDWWLWRPAKGGEGGSSSCFFIRKTIRRVAKQYANSCRDLIILQLPELFLLLLLLLLLFCNRKIIILKSQTGFSKELTENSFCRLKTFVMFEIFCTKFALKCYSST